MTHLDRHNAAFKAGRISAAQLREACPFAYPPADTAMVAALIQRTVRDEGHRGKLPPSASTAIPTHGAKYVRVERRKQILAYLRGNPWVTRHHVARAIGVTDATTSDLLSRLSTGGEVKSTLTEKGFKLFALFDAEPRHAPKQTISEYDSALLAHIRANEWVSTTFLSKTMNTGTLRLKTALQRLLEGGHIVAKRCPPNGSRWNVKKGC